MISQLKALDEHQIMTKNTLYNMIARKYLNNDISIVMLTHNRTGKTIECIDSFLRVLDRPDIRELVILDNSSKELELLKYLQYIENRYSKVRVIYSPENLGVCPGRIKLFDEAQGDIICSVDSDLELIDPVFFDHAKHYLMDETVGLVGVSGANMAYTPSFGSHQDIPEVDTLRFVDTCAGCCQVFRRDLRYYDIRLDPKYGKFWLEDTDFCFQIRMLGKKILLMPQDGLVNHSWGGSGNKMKDLIRTNWRYFVEKWRNHQHLFSLDLNLDIKESSLDTA